MLTALGDERGFVHKRLFRGITGFLQGGPLGAAAGFISGGGRAAPTVRLTRAQAMTRFGAGATAAELASVGVAPIACPAGFVLILGKCVPTSVPSAISAPSAIFSTPTFGGVNGGGGLMGPPEPDQFGAARVGRYGAGIEPAVVDRRHLICPRGSILGKQEADGSFLCYNRGDISNKERKYPRGRRPLLTGGEVRAISIASSAAKKFQSKEKQLQELGLVKKPASASTALIKAKAELEAIKAAHYAGK